MDSLAHTHAHTTGEEGEKGKTKFVAGEFCCDLIIQLVKLLGTGGRKQNKNKHHKEKASNVLRWASSAVFARFCAPTKSKKGKKNLHSDSPQAHGLGKVTEMFQALLCLFLQLQVRVRLSKP